MTQEDTQPLIEFPSTFPIKVMGVADAQFLPLMTALIQTIVPSFNAAQIETRASSGGRYMSLTCFVTVESQMQLDDVYRAISAHPLVKFAL